MVNFLKKIFIINYSKNQKYLLSHNIIYLLKTACISSSTIRWCLRWIIFTIFLVSFEKRSKHRLQISHNFWLWYQIIMVSAYGSCYGMINPKTRRYQRLFLYLSSLTYFELHVWACLKELINSRTFW